MKEKILVVDDEPLILNTIKRALAKLGYDVRITSDPESFIDELKAEPASLLIMDLNLGKLKSSSLMDKIRKISPSSKVLIISGVIPEHNDMHFLEKPFRLDELRQKVRDILDEP